ncbi:MAG: sulfatase-like hydrolase/transferase, partial [Oscillospiraceae bacterium]|nr:sulfatase-like hydrolase/transferase [Oscillospiraceae bacterium]
KEFYNPSWGASTIDGEYVACSGLIPKVGVWSLYRSAFNYMPFYFGHQFRRLGYSTHAYHNHKFDYYSRDVSHPNMGYDYKALGLGLDVTVTWPESDLEMMELTVGDYMDDPPFHAYYMTVSGHLMYSFGANAMSRKNREYVDGLDLSDSAKAYLACQIELDRALEYLLGELEARGMAENTVFVLSADHYPYGLEMSAIEELAGHKMDTVFTLERSAAIIYRHGMEPVEVDRPCASFDLIPTVSNLFGLRYDSRLLSGTDIFGGLPPLVIFQDRSFISDLGAYEARTGRFTPAEGAFPDGDHKDYLSEMRRFVDAKFAAAAKIIDLDYFGVIRGEIDANFG